MEESSDLCLLSWLLHSDLVTDLALDFNFCSIAGQKKSFIVKKCRKIEKKKKRLRTKLQALVALLCCGKELPWWKIELKDVSNDNMRELFIMDQ